MSAQDKQPQYDDATIAEYAIGVLPHVERVAFQKALKTDQALQERLRIWEEEMVPQSDTIEQIPAPQSVFDAVEDRLFEREQTTQTWWSGLKNWRLPALTSAAAILLLGLFVWNDARFNGETNNMYLADITNQSYEIQIVGIFDPDTSEFNLRRLVGVPEQNRDFELWLIDG
ncbi:MAG: hypothetical protein ABJ349_18180, partial [Hyphomicrobiales bacterium]